MWMYKSYNHMRLFIAVEVPAEVKEFLYQIGAKLSRYKGINNVNKENMHLTLLFLGERSDVKEIVETLKKISFKKITLETDDFGFFPDKKRIRVIWLGLKHSDELFYLQGEISNYFEEDREFKPHITFARVKFLKPNEKKALLHEMNSVTKPYFKFKVDKFKLYSSELTSMGPIHRVIETFPADK